MNKFFTICVTILLSSCASRAPKDQSATVVSMQIIDRNGFTETISNKDRLTSFQTTNFLASQPFQKVLRIYGRNTDGQSTSKITSYHENGQLWQYMEAVDGRAHGIYQEWFPNGVQKIEACLLEGVADIHDLAQSTWVFQGQCKVWDDQANLAAEFNYEKGLLHNTSNYFFADGKLKKTIPYQQGEIHGLVQTFDEEGHLIEEIPYFKGEKSGVARAYWSLDQPLSIEVYEEGFLKEAEYFEREGNCIAEVKAGQGKLASFKEGTLSTLFAITNGLIEGEMQFFHPNGALHCVYTLKEGKKNGEEREYYPTEKKETLKPKLSLNWSEDKIQGQVKTWYPNGKLESQREINDNKKQGTSFAWYRNGDLMLVEEYENDLLLKGSYYKKGDKQAVSKVESGKGTASLYTSDGIFLKKIAYEKGKPQLNHEQLR